MAEQRRAWKRQGEAFWRAHHEWKRSDLNQRQYCEAHDQNPAGRRILVPEKSAIDATLGRSLKQAQLIGLPIGSLQRAAETVGSEVPRR